MKKAFLLLALGLAMLPALGKTADIPGRADQVKEQATAALEGIIQAIYQGDYACTPTTSPNR